MQNGFTNDKAKKLFSYLRGRLNYLQHLQKIHDEIENSDDICGDVKKVLIVFWCIKCPKVVYSQLKESLRV